MKILTHKNFALYSIAHSCTCYTHLHVCSFYMHIHAIYFTCMKHLFACIFYIQHTLHACTFYICIHGHVPCIIHIVCTGCRSCEDPLWQTRSAESLHQRSELHDVSKPQTHHPALWHCPFPATHAGESVGVVYKGGPILSPECIEE